MLQFIPVVVLMILFFVMMFGIGFILNMLMKTTWFPCYLFVIVILPVVVYSLWNRDQMTLLAHLGSFQLVDYLTGLAGLAGAFLSGWTIKTLRIKGFKMF
ncbi:YuiB family protein [Paenibacillus sp. DMB20]|uniref:YuiB family protein n=1 Tax=Paenibacillus sp. DMB20 TaxID=1642570 RepID=UPI0009E3E359|nr:YuiB family protein [Paenibacillus sp. DMB20]